MKYPQGCIIQFAKTPELGKVKTRLIPSIGAEKALALHQHFLEKTLVTCLTANLCPVELWLSDPSSTNASIAAIAERYQPDIRWQQGEDLGERMMHAIAEVLECYDFIILIGSDCPTLDRAYLEIAVEQLVTGEPESKAVIGPAEDGGYVLIGLRQIDPLIFSNIDWGSAQVFEQTRQRLMQIGWNVIQLPTLWDLDRPEDLARLLLPTKEIIGLNNFFDVT